jgi:hypothetical protein
MSKLLHSASLGSTSILGEQSLLVGKVESQLKLLFPRGIVLSDSRVT